MNNLVKVSHHYWMLLKLSIKLKSTSAAKWGTLFSNKEVQQGIPRNVCTNPYMSPYVETVSCGELFSRKYIRRACRDLQKFIFFIKTSKWEKWWSWCLRMTNAFILCNLLWKVQKSLAANREGSFNSLVSIKGLHFFHAPHTWWIHSRLIKRYNHEYGPC